MVTLVAVDGKFKGNTYQIEDAFLIGKDARNANLVYPNNYDSINMFHCKIEVEFGKVYLTDLASPTGTYLSDGTRLRSNIRYSLLDGECFYIDNRNEIFRIGIKKDNLKPDVSITEPIEPIKEEPSITEPVEPVKEEPSITEPVEPVKEEPSITEPIEPVKKKSSVTEVPVLKNKSRANTNFAGVLIFLMIIVIGIIVMVALIEDETYSDASDYTKYRQNTVCESCGGTGKVVCGMCGGTGQMLTNNQYYDAVMGWQYVSGYTACSGCSGTGYFLCSNCGGLGHK